MQRRGRQQERHKNNRFLKSASHLPVWDQRCLLPHRECQNVIGWAQLDPPVMQGNDVLISANTEVILTGTVVQKTIVIGHSQNN